MAIIHPICLKPLSPDIFTLACDPVWWEHLKLRSSSSRGCVRVSPICSLPPQWRASCISAIQAQNPGAQFHMCCSQEWSIKAHSSSPCSFVQRALFLSISLFSFSSSIKETITSEEVRRDTHQRIRQEKCSLFLRTESHICKNFVNKSELAKKIHGLKKKEEEEIFGGCNLSLI